MKDSVSWYLMTYYKHPYQITSRQTEKLTWVWKTMFIPPKPMKVSWEYGFMDDFGTLQILDTSKTTGQFPREIY